MSWCDNINTTANINTKVLILISPPLILSHVLLKLLNVVNLNVSGQVSGINIWEHSHPFFTLVLERHVF